MSRESQNSILTSWKSKQWFFCCILGLFIDLKNQNKAILTFCVFFGWRQQLLFISRDVNDQRYKPTRQEDDCASFVWFYGVRPTRRRRYLTQMYDKSLLPDETLTWNVEKSPVGVHARISPVTNDVTQVGITRASKPLDLDSRGPARE